MGLVRKGGPDCVPPFLPSCPESSRTRRETPPVFRWLNAQTQRQAVSSWRIPHRSKELWAVRIMEFATGVLLLALPLPNVSPNCLH